MMWRCSCCRKRFEERGDGIDHARASHSRDYTACEYAPRRLTRARGLSVLLAPIGAVAALLTRAR